MDKLISFAKRLIPVSATLEAELQSRFRFTTKKKNQFLLYEGEICRYAWFLQKGLVRCYFNRGKYEVTTWFVEEGHMIVLHESLCEEKESLYNLQAIEDCELYGIRFEDMHHVLDTYRETSYIRDVVARRFVNLAIIRVMATSMRSPSSRYAYFLKHFPQLLGRLTLVQIASYLDMSKSSVARARRNKL